MLVINHGSNAPSRGKAARNRRFTLSSLLILPHKDNHIVKTGVRSRRKEGDTRESNKRTGLQRVYMFVLAALSGD